MKKTFKAKAKCNSCGGTGLYKGMAEREGCAVICYTCKGTGCQNIEINYTPFTKRQPTTKIKRVFANSCGYGHTAEDYTSPEGKEIKFSQGGCTYKEFLKGIKPKPVKDLYCPYLWTQQGLQSKDIGGLYKTRCDKCGLLGKRISECSYWEYKSTCWEIYEKGGGK